MRARQLLDGNGPLFRAETMDAVNKALDTLWAKLAGQYQDAAAVDQARLKLAECVLAVTKDGDEMPTRSRGWPFKCSEL
jgi:alcohol dehydrogenase class IV